MDWSEVARTAPFITTAAILGWWLSARFRETEIRLETLLNNHEIRDQQRHEENVIRFTKIETKLDTLNGKNEHI